MNHKMNWKFHWLTRWEEIWDESFVQQWQRWLDESPSAHAFFHPALVRAWIETYMPLRDIRPYFLIAESNKQKVFFPLVLWRRNWKNAFQRLLIPVGYSDYDYHDPIIVHSDGDTLDNMESFWYSFKDELLNNAPVRFDHVVLDGVRRRFAGKGNQWKRCEICPWADLSQFNTIEEFLNSLKGSLRGDLRRQARRMKEIGEINFQIFDKSRKRDAHDELGPFLQAHSKRWPLAYKAPHFHEHILNYGIEAGCLHFSILRISGVSIAWHLGFIYHNRFYYYLPAQNEDYANLSPGKMLLFWCVEEAIKQRIQIFDHLRGEESYKIGWADKSDILWSLELKREKIVSRIKDFAVDEVKPRLQHFAKLK